MTMGPTVPAVLIVDDDPSHLEIYGMIVKLAGFDPVPVLVRFDGPDPVPQAAIGLILLDYRLNSVLSTPEIARLLRSRYPEVPLILLSDLWSPPPEMMPLIDGFVRKGKPEKLIEKIRATLPTA